MVNDEIPGEWDDIEFMFEATAEAVEANYGKAFSIVRKGIENNLLETENLVDSKRLLHAIGLLITCLESSLADTHGIKFNHESKYKRSESKCSFCCKTRSKVKTLVGGASDFICDLCVTNIFNELNENV
jgi:hypothetical protein